MHNLTLRNIKEDTAVRSQISQNSDSLSRNISTCYDIRSLGVQYRFLGHERYTECPGRNVPDFGKMFLKLKYTDLIKKTYIRSSTVTEIMARERCGFFAVPLTVPDSRDFYPYTAHVRLSFYSPLKRIQDVTAHVKCLEH